MVFKMHCSYCVFDKNTHMYFTPNGSFTESSSEKALWLKNRLELEAIQQLLKNYPIGFDVAYSFERLT